MMPRLPSVCMEWREFTSASNKLPPALPTWLATDCLQQASALGWQQFVYLTYVEYCKHVENLHSKSVSADLASDGVRFARSRLTVRKDGAVVPLEAAR